MSYPGKPSNYQLVAGERLLKTALPETSDAFKGITADEREYAEDYAWAIIVARFHGFIDVSDWDYQPPPLVAHIWDLWASAHYMRAVSRNLEQRGIGETGPSLIESWEGRASMMVKSIIDPDTEGDRMVLVSMDGNIIHPRSDVGVPEVRSSGTRFFPDLDTGKSHGFSTGQSAEEIYKTIAVRSRTGNV